MFLRFTHIVCISRLFFFISEYYFIIRGYHSLFTLLVDTFAVSVRSCFSRARPCATLSTVDHKPLLSMGFSRQEYWSGLPWCPPGDLPAIKQPAIKPVPLTCPALAGGFFTTSATWEALCCFQFGAIINEATQTSLYKSFCNIIFYLDQDLGVNLLVIVIDVCLTLSETSRKFSRDCTIL